MKYPLEDLAKLVNPSVLGWLNYYGRFYRSRCVGVLRQHFTWTLTAWVRRKFKRLRGSKGALADALSDSPSPPGMGR